MTNIPSIQTVEGVLRLCLSPLNPDTYTSTHRGRSEPASLRINSFALAGEASAREPFQLDAAGQSVDTNARPVQEVDIHTASYGAFVHGYVRKRTPAVITPASQWRQKGRGNSDSVFVGRKTDHHASRNSLRACNRDLSLVWSERIDCRGLARGRVADAVADKRKPRWLLLGLDRQKQEKGGGWNGHYMSPDWSTTGWPNAFIPQ